MNYNFSQKKSPARGFFVAYPEEKPHLCIVDQQNANK